MGSQGFPGAFGQRSTHSYLGGMQTLIETVDDQFTSLLRRCIVLIWFGALKGFNVTPVTDLVANTVYWVDPDWFVPVLGVVEVIVGFGLVVRRALRAVLFVFLAQMLGTFLVMIVQPDVAFQDGNVLKLTVEGEFVIKNLVLLAAGLVVGATVRRSSEQI